MFEGSRRRPKTAVAASQAALDAIERTVPSQVKADKSLASAEQRAWFLHTMRPFFGSDASTVGHFAQIREVAIKGARTLMHEEAAARLESVQQRLGEARMPSSSGVGWSFRSDFGPGTAPQSLGNLHHVGLAIDYNAYEAPHLGARGKTLDPRQTDLIRMVTGRAPGMELGGYDKTLPMLAELGRATMSGDREKIEEVEGRKDVRAFLDRVAAETDALSRASRRFRDSLGPGGARLQDLQKEYLAAGSEEARRKVTDQLPAVLAPWIKMVEADILQTRVAVVLGALNPFGPPVGEELHAERDRARKLWSRWEVVSKTIEGGAPLTPRLQRTASQLVQEAGTMLGVLAPAAPGPDFQSQFRALTPLLKTRTAALGHKIWLERLVALRAGLVGDPSFVLTSEVLTDRSGKVVRDKEGRPMPKPEAGLPPLAQLAEKGYFTLKDESTSASAFGPDFVMEMAKHGFNLGATYGDTPDSMHFELRWLQGRPPS